MDTQKGTVYVRRSFQEIELARPEEGIALIDEVQGGADDEGDSQGALEHACREATAAAMEPLWHQGCTVLADWPILSRTP